MTPADIPTELEDPTAAAPPLKPPGGGGSTPPGPGGFDITPINIEDEMRRSYLDYAMSVIVARAIPDIRDGLKPVHRRILYSMKENNNVWNRGYVKSARIAGDAMGKYHPHGNAAIYDAMVRMAQNFSLRVPLIDGQGNFGSLDGDPPAAERYTEARLAKVAEHLLADIDKDTVNFVPNYDETLVEPVVLPAEFPNLLVNGAGGIAVGMATNIPPHNLGEVIDACYAYLDDRSISDEALMALVPGPDFPTGGIIIGRAGIRDGYLTGRGSITIRARHHIETLRKEREAIIVTEIPYQVNKSKMVERIGEVVNGKIIEGISDLRDESDRDGVRVVIELKRDAVADVVLAQLFRHTQMQQNFGTNLLALKDGRPETLTLRQFISAFIDFRETVITRRTVFLLRKARERAHVLAGLAIAVANIEDVIALIRDSIDPQTARSELMARAWPAADMAPFIQLIDDPSHRIESDGTYYLSETQARAILDLRLQRLTGLERDKIGGELTEFGIEIEDHLAVLRSPQRLREILRGELVAIREEFATPRRTDIEESELDYDIEALIQREDCVVTVSHGGYIKRVKLASYRAQRRGGKGRAGMATRDEDFVDQVFVANTHTPMLFFTTFGRAFELKVWRLPEGTPQGRGKAMINLLPLQPEERIATIMPLPELEEREGLDIMFATSKGEVRRNDLANFLNIKSNGKIAMKLEDEDGNSLGNLIAVASCRDDQDVLLATMLGKAIRFSVTDVRQFTGRTSTGVRGIRLAVEDELISMTILHAVKATPEEREAYLRLAVQRRRSNDDEEIVENNDLEISGEDEVEGADVDGSLAAVTIDEARYAELASQEEFVLTVTEKGFGKRTSAFEYRKTGRGGQGIANIEITPRNGNVIAAFPVTAGDQIMLVTDNGQLIRTPIHDVRIAGRRTQGVTLFRVAEEERVVSVTRLNDLIGDETEIENEEDGDVSPIAESDAEPENNDPA